jgi:hypothetical protein
MPEDSEYDIGYGRPPKTSQFQKGKSGNSSGRPKEVPGIAEVFRKVSKQKVRTNGPDGQRCMSKLEASVTQLVNKAATGDLKAMKVLMQMASHFPELVTGPEPPIVITVRGV